MGDVDGIEGERCTCTIISKIKKLFKKMFFQNSDVRSLVERLCIV